MKTTPSLYRIGFALVAMALVAVIGATASPARALSNGAGQGFRVIDRQGWRMTVPGDWESYAFFGPDSPFTVAYLYAPSSPADSASEASVEDPDAEPYLKVLVSRLPSDVTADLELAWAAKCDRCLPDTQREVRAVDLHGRWGVREDILRADGSRVWILVVQNDCHTYRVYFEAPAAHAAQAADTVERVLSSASVARTGKMIGRCWR